MKQPKPFHIGTRVKTIQSDQADKTFAVVCCIQDKTVILDALDGEFWSHSGKTLLFHADDGSPLGEWVPIKGDASGVFDGNYGTSNETREPAITIEQANAIIRGEVVAP